MDSTFNFIKNITSDKEINLEEKYFIEYYKSLLEYSKRNYNSESYRRIKKNISNMLKNSDISNILLSLNKI